MSSPSDHSIAELFPLMGDAELAELAEDIRVNGMHEPIVLTTDGRILDGRNRFRARQMVDSPAFNRDRK